MREEAKYGSARKMRGILKINHRALSLSSGSTFTYRYRMPRSVYYHPGIDRRPKKYQQSGIYKVTTQEKNGKHGKNLKTSQLIDQTLDEIYSSSKTIGSLKFDGFVRLEDLLRFNGISIEEDNFSLEGNTKSGKMVNKSEYDEQNTGQEENDEGSNMHVLTDERNELNDNTDIKIDIDQKLRKFVLLEEFDNANNTPSQVLEVCLENLPAYILSKSSLVESFLNYIILKMLKIYVISKKDNNEHVFMNLEYKWSFVDIDSIVDSRVIFIKFEDVMGLYLFKKLVNNFKLKDGAFCLKTVNKEVMDAKVFKKIDEMFILKDEKKITLMIQKKIAEYSRKIEKVAKEYELLNDPVDEFNKLYNNYQVDPKDLTDVPQDMVENVKQKVMDFRLHVLKAEKEKKEKRLLKEKRKSRMKLKQLFNDLNKIESSDALAVDIDNEFDEELENDEDQEAIQEYSDYELEQLQEAQLKKKVESEYIYRLMQYKKKEEIRLKNRISYLNVVKHRVYIEDYVPHARRKFIESFVEGVINENNKIDSSFDYYIKHNNYLKFRNRVKIDEEKMDELDRLEEEQNKNNKNNNNTSTTLADSMKEKPLKISFKKKAVTPQAKSEHEQEKSKNGTEMKLSKGELLPKVKEKIEEIIEKYLGMVEDSLVDFMFNYIKGHMELNKESNDYKSFVSELSETLDEDAPVAIDKMYEYADSLLR